MNHTTADDRLNLEIAEGEARRWRDLALRMLAFTACLSEHPAFTPYRVEGRGPVARELGRGWICLSCGMSSVNPAPPECPKCGSGGDTGDGGPLPGLAAALEAREQVRGVKRAPPPTSATGQAKPEDCPTCHGDGL